ncbi:threonine/serine exporter ThrE family protein [Frigoribacterium sp. CG_9.8]|uniref:threonine/serine ThrE exporter family protein n=1 Tax=Frigoribacterium sp. CG_9.8 TaxID=2787733 RepID=UPI001E4495E8|nr:threonine/serine exporter family protein [Frigoribacterium sp. CG_9.8]
MAFGWFQRQASRLLKQSVQGAPISSEETDARGILSMLEGLGLAMIETGQATNDVEETLRAVAKAYRLDDVRTVVLPTYVMLQSSTAGGEVRVESARPGGGRLDQTGAVETLVGRALRAEVSSQEAITEVARIRTASPRFGPRVSLLGHVILTVGFGMVINPTFGAIWVYAVLGFGVGLLVLLARKFTELASTVPVIAAFLVTLVTALLVHVVGDEPLRIIAPPLVSFLPGLTLTIAAIELTNNQVIAGASRLVYGGSQLLLLTFGVFAATTLVGGLPTASPQPLLGPWAGLLGVALVAVGFTLFMSAPRGALLWIFLSLAVTYGAQALGAVAIGAGLSGFVGAVVVAPFTRFASHFRTSPPASVMSLACLWLLVPGALGFIGLSGVAEGGVAGIQTLATAGISVLSIALGAIVGISLSRDAGRLARSARRGVFRR